MFTHLFLYHRHMAIIVKIDILNFLIRKAFYLITYVFLLFIKTEKKTPPKTQTQITRKIV